MNRQKVCALIGAGQLGSRYLQGLLAVNFPLQIFVVDPSLVSLSLAQVRAKEVVVNVAHKVFYIESIDSVPDHIDLAIISTPSHCRLKVVENLSNKKIVKSWILEKVLAQSSSQLDLMYSLLSDNKSVWVNTPMRAMDWHKRIKAQMIHKASMPLSVKVTGGNWGLACNAIHYMDLVAWWTNQHIIDVRTDELGVWRPSKRDGFKEVDGSLLILYSDQTSLTLECNPTTNPLEISVLTQESHWLINETNGSAFGPDGLSVFGTLSYQSIITAPLVIDILDNCHCLLPTFSESRSQHNLFLDSLLHHWNSTQNRQDTLLPIT